MAADKELLKEVALELWNTTKKLRPGLPKAPRAQLVLKALLTIGDMSDQLEAAMVGIVIGIITEGLTGAGIVHQIGLGPLVDGYAACRTQFLPFCF